MCSPVMPQIRTMCKNTRATHSLSRVSLVLTFKSAVKAALPSKKNKKILLCKCLKLSSPPPADFRCWASKGLWSVFSDSLVALGLTQTELNLLFPSESITASEQASLSAAAVSHKALHSFSAQFTLMPTKLADTHRPPPAQQGRGEMGP